MNLQASIRIPRRAKDGIDGDTGKGISEVKDFYGLSSIETSEPTEWFSYIPNKPADKYLWNYEKIIYTDGNSIETKKRVIQGKDARSIQSIVNAYAYSASETVSPTGGWRSTIASLGAKPIGYFLWVRDNITYTDGTSSSTAGYVVKDGKDGQPGQPGQIPIQKEWKVGDTHRNTDEIIDYIYVRGANKNVSYYYKRATKGTTTAGAPPTGGTTPTGYLRIDWLKELAVNVLLAEEANVAGFIFKGGQLISVRGTVGGVDADYSGQAGFVPNLILDGTEGNVKITGEVSAISGMIGSMLIKDNKIVSKDERIEIDGDGSRIILKDSNSAVKTVIHPNDISSIGDYFDTGGSYNADLSYLNSDNFTGTDIVSLAIGGSSSETHELAITGFDIETYLSVYLGGGDPDEYVEASTIVQLVKDGVEMVRLAEATATSFADQGGAIAHGGMQSRTFTVSGNATYSVRVVHSIQQPQGGATATSYAKVSGMTTMTTGKVVNRSEIGNNGMVIATSSLNYTYDVGSLFQVRRGNIGFQVTSNGVKKSNNMSSPTPLWTNIE